MAKDFSIEKINWFKVDWNFFEGFTVALFAYTCHTNIFAVRLELARPVVRRMNKIFFRAVFYEMIIYTAVAVAGYLSFLDHTPPVIIYRKPLHPDDGDYLMIVG